MFIRKAKYEDLKYELGKIKENRRYWEEQFQLMKENKESLEVIISELRKDRDEYKKQSEEYYNQYRKVLASNGGYSTSNKKLKEELDNNILELKETKKLKEELELEIRSMQEQLKKAGIIIAIQDDKLRKAAVKVSTSNDGLTKNPKKKRGNKKVNQ